MAQWEVGVALQLNRRNAFELHPFKELVSMCQKAQQRANALQAHNRELRSEVDSLSSQVAAAAHSVPMSASDGASAREKALQEKVDQQASQYSRLVEKLSTQYDNSHKLSQMQEDLAAAHKQCRALQDAKKSLEERLQEVSIRYDTCSRELESVRSVSTLQTERYVKLTADNEHLTREILLSKDQQAQLQMKIMELETTFLHMRQSRQMEAEELGGQPQPSAQSSQRFFDSSANFTAGPTPSSLARGYVIETLHGDVECYTVTFSGDSRQLWSSGADKLIRQWEGNNGAPLNRIHAGCAARSLETHGSNLLGGCGDSTCRVWDVQTLRQRFQLTGHTEPVSVATFSPDAARVISSSSDRTIKTWDVNRAALLHTSICMSGCNDVAVTNDRVVSGHFDGSIRLWDPRDGKEALELKGIHERPVTCVRTLQSACYIVSLGKDNAMKLTDARTARAVWTYKHEQLLVQSNFARFSVNPTGNMVAVGSATGAVLLWAIRTAPSVAEPTTTVLSGHTGPVNCVAWAPDGRSLISLGSDRRLTSWK